MNETWEPTPKEPTPEDMSYLSNENVEFCCTYYFRELGKRDPNDARDLLLYLKGVLDEIMLTPGHPAQFHRQSP
jgi:hypothetical protein